MREKEFWEPDLKSVTLGWICGIVGFIFGRFGISALIEHISAGR